jgi:hypothetical protein
MHSGRIVVPAAPWRFEPPSPAMPACRQPPCLVRGGVARAVVTDRSAVPSSRTAPPFRRLGPPRRPAASSSRCLEPPRRPAASSSRCLEPPRRPAASSSRLADWVDRSAVTSDSPGRAALGDWDSPGPVVAVIGHRPDPTAAQCRGGQCRWAPLRHPGRVSASRSSRRDVSLVTFVAHGRLTGALSSGTPKAPPDTRRA